MAKTKKKLWCVAFTSSDEWDNPTIFHVEANTRNEAINLAAEETGVFGGIDDLAEDSENNYLAFEITKPDIIK